jgi:Flp pilus assembly protein TadD
MESGMSLLNDALRKKNKEQKQLGKVNLFRNAPAGRRDNRGKKYVFLASILAACIVVIWVVWQLFLQPDSSLINPQMARKKISEAESVPPAPETVQARIPLAPSSEVASAPETPVQTIEPSDTAKSKTDTVAAVTQEQDGQKDDKVIPAHKGQPKTDDKQLKTPLTAKGLEKKDERGGGNKTGAQESRKTAASHGSEEPFYLKAVSYHRRNELGKAIQMYQEVLRKNPEHYEALFNLASAYLTEASFSEAYNILQKLHELDPENPQVLLNLAIAEIGLGRPRKAMSYLNESDALEDASQFEICFHKGVAMSKLHMLNEAEVWYMRAEELNPNHSRLIFNMAVVYDKLQRYQEALRYYGAFLKNEGAQSAHEKKEVENRIKAIRVYMAGQSL